MPVIYIDVLLALNLFIDFLLLSAVADSAAPYRRLRLSPERLPAARFPRFCSFPAARPCIHPNQGSLRL